MSQETLAENQDFRVGTTRNIVLVAFPDVQMLDVCGPFDAFSLANLALQITSTVGQPTYQLKVVAAQAGPLDDLVRAADRRASCVRRNRLPDRYADRGWRPGGVRTGRFRCGIGRVDQRKRRHGYGGSHPSAPVPFCSPRAVSWTVGERPRIGVSPSNWRTLTPRSPSRPIGSSSGMATSTPRVG